MWTALGWSAVFFIAGMPCAHAAKAHPKKKAAASHKAAAHKAAPHKTTPLKTVPPPADPVPASRPRVQLPVRPAPEPPVDVTNLPGELPLVAQGAIVLDALTGETLYAKNADQPFYPASTTKILTALLVIEAGDLDREVVADLEETKVGESSLQLRPGDHYSRRELLYGLMLKSANDVAHLLARDNAGSIEAFAEKMNQRARALGATNSHFMNPHGLHDPQHFTTPHDLALITRAAMQQPLFRQIVGTDTHPWESARGPEILINHNRLLREFPGCTGVKTGYTSPAGNVLVSAALWSTREVICVVMHTDRPGQWNDSRLLLSYGFAHLPASAPAAP